MLGTGVLKITCFSPDSRICFDLEVPQEKLTSLTGFFLASPHLIARLYIRFKQASSRLMVPSATTSALAAKYNPQYDRFELLKEPYFERTLRCSILRSNPFCDFLGIVGALKQSRQTPLSSDF